MENNDAIRKLVDMINQETIFIRKPFAMYAGYRFKITAVNTDKIHVTVIAYRDQEKCEHFIYSYLHAMLNFLKDMLPLPICEVTFYHEPEAKMPHFVKLYPFYRPGLGTLESNVLLIEENAQKIREKIRESFGPLLKELKNSPMI
jgi:hypothetical protein